MFLDGITCYDAFTESEFTLHAYILAWTGDIPALSKVMNITGHNSFSGCRFCEIQGVYSHKYKHVYFSSEGTYAKKNHTDWLSHLNEIEVASTSKDKKSLIKKYGKYK